MPFVADVADWLRGTRAISTDLEQLSGDLRDTARDADRAADGIERSWEDAADDSARAFRTFADDVDDAFDRVRRDADKAGADVADDLSDGLSARKGRVGAVGAEVGDELVENLGEAVRSGNPADLVLESFTSLGPALGALGIGAAVVTGLVSSFINKAQEERQRLVDAASSLFDSVAGNAELTGREAAAAFRRGFVEVGEVGAQLQTILGTDTVVDAWSRVGTLVERTGLSADDVTAAILGNRDALALVEAALLRNDAAADGVYRRIRATDGGASELAQSLSDSLAPLDDQKNALRDVRKIGSEAADQNARAAENQRLAREATKGLKAQMREAKGEASGTADQADRVRGRIGAANDAADRLNEKLGRTVDKKVNILWGNAQVPVPAGIRAPTRKPT